MNLRSNTSVTDAHGHAFFAVRQSLSVLLLCASWSAKAEWRPVVLGDTNGDPTPIFIDAPTVRQQGKLRKAWFLTQYLKDQVLPDSGKRYRSTKTLWFFDCKARASGFKQTVYYSDFDAKQVIDSFERDQPKLSEIVPDSVGEDMLGAACSRKISR
jgi:hypothetical protein